ARKDKGMDDEAVGRHGKDVAKTCQIRDRQPGAIIARREALIAILEQGGEHIVDQVAHRLAAAAVRERDRRPADRGAALVATRADRAHALAALLRSPSMSPYW